MFWYDGNGQDPCQGVLQEASGMCCGWSYPSQGDLSGGCFLHFLSRGQSVLLWPFVLEADLVAAGESLSDHLAARRSTSGHIECFHQFYEGNKAFLKNVLGLPLVASMIEPSASSVLKSSSLVASGASVGSAVIVSRAIDGI